MYCKRYGGGGRINVGAIIVDDYLKAKHIFDQVKSYLIKKRNEAFRKFYLRPRIIAKYAKLLLEKPKFIPLLFNDFISFVKMVRAKPAH